MKARWWYVSLPWATFALAAVEGVVTLAPPIARQSKGRAVGDVLIYWRRRGAQIQEMTSA